jgi:mono/diheme cytochrome c family protein
MNRLPYVVLGVVVLGMAATVAYLAVGRPAQRPAAGGMGMGGAMAGPRPTSFASSGERIFYTAKDDRGSRISFTGGPSWLAMHGGSCVDCHGADGRGGKPVMMGTAMPTDIRYQALTSAEHAEHAEHMEHPPYTDELIKRAITEGLDPGGKPLDKTMPRWKMPDRDLDDVIAYLKQLSGGKAPQ